MSIQGLFFNKRFRGSGMCCGGERLCRSGSGTPLGETWCGSRTLRGSWSVAFFGTEAWWGSGRLNGSRSGMLFRSGTWGGSGCLHGSRGGTLLGSEMWCGSGRLCGSRGRTLFGTETWCGSGCRRGSRRGSRRRLLGSKWLFATAPAWHWWRNNYRYCKGSCWGSFSNRGSI